MCTHSNLNIRKYAKLDTVEKQTTIFVETYENSSQVMVSLGCYSILTSVGM